MDIFLAAFITLFVIVDPLGTSAVFPSLVRNYKAPHVRLIAFKAAIVSSCILILFGIGGQALLTYLGISIPAFRIAGGLLLFVTGFRMIMGFHDQDQVESEKNVYNDKSDVAIFPLAVPLLAGPGSMTATLLHMTKAESFSDKGMIIAAIIAVQLIALVSMLGAERLVRFFGPTGSTLLARLVGILMAAMAIQFLIDGVRQIFA
ncbi:MAG: marC integral membrane family protein [Alphaproteobacteria bacterium RIFCSPHIGHO2_12_FULL_45_9]|nr:MAG: marC integral membrane family protein [Alphaproteobacteria bacterium RIFCSPHIGHO2_12_FULL_45_9]